MLNFRTRKTQTAITRAGYARPPIKSVRMNPVSAKHEIPAIAYSAGKQDKRKARTNNNAKLNRRINKITHELSVLSKSEMQIEARSGQTNSKNAANKVQQLLQKHNNSSSNFTDYCLGESAVLEKSESLSPKSLLANTQRFDKKDIIAEKTPHFISSKYNTHSTKNANNDKNEEMDMLFTFGDSELDLLDEICINPTVSDITKKESHEDSSSAETPHQMEVRVLCDRIHRLETVLEEKNEIFDSLNKKLSNIVTKNHVLATENERLELETKNG